METIRNSILVHLRIHMNTAERYCNSYTLFVDIHTSRQYRPLSELMIDNGELQVEGAYWGELYIASYCTNKYESIANNISIDNHFNDEILYATE